MAKYNELTVGQSEACINRMGGWDNFLRFIGGQGKVVFETILTLLRITRIAAQPTVTISEEYFKEAGMVWANDTFQAEFYGLEVPATEETELAVRKLEEASLDTPILAELGDNAEISVSQFKAFLAANRESSEWFIFYFTGRNGKRAVHAFWHVARGGWYVDADSVAAPDGWSQGRRVVSRKTA